MKKNYLRGWWLTGGLIGAVFLCTGCVRLWGGTYKAKPGETVQKTYILDTYEFTAPGSVSTPKSS